MGASGYQEEDQVGRGNLRTAIQDVQSGGNKLPERMREVGMRICASDQTWSIVVKKKATQINELPFRPNRFSCHTCHWA